MKTVFLSGDYFHNNTRYIDPKNPTLIFKRLEELDDWECNNEVYYYHIHLTDTSDIIRESLSLENVSSYVGPESSSNNKERFRRKINLFIPTRIKEDVRSGRCKYLIDHSLEGYWGIRWDYIKFIFQCEYNDIVWLTGNSILKDSNNPVETHYCNWWERQCLEGVMNHGAIQCIQPEQINLIENKTPRKKMCTYYNRRIRTHRINMMCVMHHNNLLDNTYWSWGGNVDNSVDWNHTLKKYHMQMGAAPYEKSYDTLSTWGNLQNGMLSKENLAINLVNTLNKEHILDTNFQFIIETWATSGDTTFLSEKSFKPFMLMQPFITYGDRYTVRTLREYGYNVFDKWINHSYDTIKDPMERAEAVVVEMKRLQSFTSIEWADILYDMRDALVYNVRNLEKSLQRCVITLK